MLHYLVRFLHSGRSAWKMLKGEGLGDRGERKDATRSKSAAVFFGSSRNSGERGADLEEEVFLVAVPVSP
ncbi:hypothetical protein Q3O85_08535, partial [Ralstonia pseudosolanacearum]|nr:hypothetical protein [Ralstonia pseudosolanacearum]